MPAYLITGAAGFLGSHIANRFAAVHQKHRLVLLDHLGPTSHPGNIDTIVDHDRVISVVGDVRNSGLLSELIRSHDITHIIHCAADNFTDGRTEDVTTLLDSNVVATLSLLEAARAVWSRKQPMQNTHFHYVSCADILGPGKEGAIDDVSPARPETLFTAAKAAAEAYVNGYASRYRMVATISHPTTIFGSSQFPDKRIAAMICAMLEGRRIPVYGNGNEQINLISAAAVAAAIMEICAGGKSSGRYGISGETISIRDVTGMISTSLDRHFAENAKLTAYFQRSPAAQKMHSHSLVTMVQDRRQTHRPNQYCFRRLHDELDVPVYNTLASDMHQAIGWYANHPKWWQSIIDGSYRTRPEKMLMVG